LNKKSFSLIGLAVLALLGGGVFVKYKMGQGTEQTGLGGIAASGTVSGSAGDVASAKPSMGAASKGIENKPANGSASALSKGPAKPVVATVIELSAQELFKLSPSDLSRQVPITGTLRATNQTLVKSKVAGELTELLVREGSEVKAGQLLAKIDTLDFDLRIKERDAQLRGAEAQLDQAKRTLENNRQLLEKNFISQSAFDTAKSSFDVAVANLDATKAQMAQAKKALNDTRVLAPMSGIVAERFAQPGEKISPDSRILSIVDLSRVELEAAIPSTDIGSVRIGQDINLSIEGVDKSFKGRVVRISPSTQAGTRSVPIYIAIENKDSRVRAGLFAQGALALDKRSNVLTIPINALREAAGRNFVYLLDGDKLAERDVKLGARDETGRAANGSEGIIEVIAGLKTGEQIVGVNLGTLRPGITVKLK
jgi:membrane fusion protein, multidrug efflux system